MPYYIDLVLKTLNECIRSKVNIITVKSIRRRNGIDSSDRCKINFIWRNLEFLEKYGFIEIYINKRPKRYRLPQKEIKIKKVRDIVIKNTRNQ